MTAPTRPELCEGRWPIAHCLSEACRAPIVWARTPKGKNTPVDVEPALTGSVLLVDKGDRVPAALVVKADERAQHAGKLRTTHWATCVRANDFRGNR